MKRGRGDIPNVDKPPPSKAPRTQITLKGGACQPPRIIGYRRTGTGCDVTVRVEKRKFECHSSVIASACPFFEKLVSSGQAFGKAIELPTPSAAAFEALLEFFYVGECSFADALLVPVLETAHHLDAASVQAELIARCTERLSPASCVDSLRLAVTLGLGPLKRSAESMVAEHFDTVRTQPSFGKLSEDFFCGLLASDALGVRQEEDAFEAAIAWLAAQPAQKSAAARQQRVKRVLSLVRFPTMSRAYVVERVLTNPILDELPEEHTPADAHQGLTTGKAADGRAAGMRLVLESYLDAFHGPPSSRCIARAGVTPPPPAAAFTIGAAPLGASGLVGGPAASPSRRKSRSPSAGRRKSLRATAR